MRYLIYCDESDDKGRFYSNFYGGALLKFSDRQRVENALLAAKGEHSRHEFKWTNIGTANEARYVDFVRAIFGLVRDGDIKFRVMFTQNIHQPSDDADHDEENRYFLLYYQFLKHAFGLQHRNEHQTEDMLISVYLDEVADTKEKFDNFKNYVSGLSNFPPFFHSGVVIPKNDIASVDSRDHLILQAVDVVLGSMQFRLNEWHKRIPEGAKRRGKRTRAKTRVYKEINRLIREGYPHFNIGTSTAATLEERYTHPYAHWRFKPKDSVEDLSRGKKKGKKGKRQAPS